MNHSLTKRTLNGSSYQGPTFETDCNQKLNCKFETLVSYLVIGIELRGLIRPINFPSFQHVQIYLLGFHQVSDDRMKRKIKNVSVKSDIFKVEI